MTQALSMRQRCPGQSVIEELLRLQDEAPSRSRIARMLGRTPLAPDAMSWYLGAKGEITVGGLLTNLPPEWTVLHALPVGNRGSDIDHIVVGPGGVFTINTKHHREKKVWVAADTLLVDGQKCRYIRDAEFEATRVGVLIEKRMPLPAPVQPILAFVAPAQLTIREKPVQVKVLESWQLNRWLTNLSPVFTEPEQDEITSILEDPTTWAMAEATVDATVDVRSVEGARGEVSADVIAGSVAARPDANTAVGDGAWSGFPAIDLDDDDSEHDGADVSVGLMAAFERLDAEVRSAAVRRKSWSVAGYALLVLVPVSGLWWLGDLLTSVGN